MCVLLYCLNQIKGAFSCVYLNDIIFERLKQFMIARTFNQDLNDTLDMVVLLNNEGKSVN